MGILITKNNIGQNSVISNKTNGSASPFQLTQRDTNKIFTNFGATAEVYLNLPVSPVVGQIFEGACVDADNMRFIAQGSQTIRLGSTVSAAAGYCQFSGIGANVKLIYLLTNQWFIVQQTGTINIV